MFSLLFVALFAFLSLSVSSRPLSSFPLTITDDCSQPTSAPPTTTLTPTTTTTTTTISSTSVTSPVPSPTSTAVTTVSDISGGPYTGGVATYYYQNGNAGACGQVNPDSAMICAMDQTRFGTSGPASPLCGQKVQITNLNNNLSIIVTIADDCPTCQNENSIDLSVGAFTALDSNLSDGEFPISWVYV